MSEPFEEMDAYRSEMIRIFVGMASAARDVVKSDGTDRLSLEQLRDVLYEYNAWLGDDEA